MSGQRRMRARSAGDATFGLIVNPREPDRMSPVIRCHDTAGIELVIELSADEVRDLHADAARLMNADQEQVNAWWVKITGGKRPTS